MVGRNWDIPVQGDRAAESEDMFVESLLRTYQIKILISRDEISLLLSLSWKQVAQLTTDIPGKLSVVMYLLYYD